MSLLEIKDASFSYPQTKKTVLNNINLKVEKGDYIAVLGTNGSGKSTLARLMAGFYQCDSGSVEIEEKVLPGIVFQQPKEQIVAGVVERDTAFGPQNFGYDKSEIELRTIECLSVVGLADRALSRTFELSLGQTQRLAFSGILALFPDLLLLDEVTAMLDPGARDEIIRFVDDWNRKGHTIIHITHDLTEAFHASRIIVLEKGNIIFDDSREKFMSSPEIISKVFCDDSYLYQKNSNPLLNEADVEKKETALDVKNISFSWDDRKVFENISFTLKKGSLVSLTGPSGCGKSTLFECLSGLQNISSGEIFAISRPSLALQESEAALFETFAADDVAFGPKNNGVQGKELISVVKKSMEMVGLSFKDYADRGTFKLSGGEKRKLSLAGIIALNKDIMIFDEPTSALDSYSRKIVLQSLRKLADEGKTVLFSTHRMEEAAIADENLNWQDLTNHKKEEFNSGEDSGNEAKVSFDSETVLAAKEKSLESGLKKMEKLENTKLLHTLHKSAQVLIAPAEIPSSPVGMLPAALKFILFAILFVSSICVKPVWLCAALFGANILYGILALFPPKKFFSAIKALLPWIILFAIIEMIFFRLDGNLLFQWKFITITDTKIFLVANIFLRAASIILCIGVFIHTTNERQILDGLSTLLWPLSVIKIPVRYAVLVVGIIFRFIPLLIDELSGIIKTQIVRGAFGKAKGFGKLKVLLSLFVPLLLQSFRKAEHLSEALTARYFS